MKTRDEILDHFAAVALNGILSNNILYESLIRDGKTKTRDIKNDTFADYIAQTSYLIAEKMIKESYYLTGKNKAK